jgi:HupE / UreJ protein
MKRLHHVPRWLGWLALALNLALLPGGAAAHKPSDSYLTINIGTNAAIQGQWDIALRDLDFALGLDADGNGEITWGEVRARHEAIASYALARLALGANGQPCTLKAGEQLVDRHTDGTYTVLAFSATCPGPAAVKSLDLGYRLFADIDPSHRGLLRLQSAGRTRSAVLGPQAPQQAFELATPSRWAQFSAYLREGVWHIWIGFDHILFLLSLLLPAVLVWQRQRQRWEPSPGFKPALVDVLKIVTAFTLAHSITLSLATLGWVELPSRWVESAIAASVVLAALNNVWPRLPGQRWAMAFVFGLVHGFGFASVLADLGLPGDALVLALVGFNVGVEVGQLAIVALFLPLAFALRRTAFYRRGVVLGGSLLIATLALVWFVERAFDLTLLGL